MTDSSNPTPISPSNDISTTLPSTSTNSKEFTPRIEKAEKKPNSKRPYPFAIWLPSQGNLYDGKFPDGEMIISPMTTQEEQLLNSKKSDRITVLNQLIKNCIVDCPVRFEDLLVSDSFYILLCIRNVSFGSDYSFNLTCPKCNTKFRKEVLVPNSLKIIALTPEDDNEPYEVTLPLSEDKITFRLLRIKDESEIRRYSQSQYSRSVTPGDPSYCYRLAMYLQTVNGEKLDAVRKLEYIENLIAKDSLVLRNNIDKREFGAELDISFDCPSCGFSDSSTMPFDREFFRPSLS